MDTFSQTRRWDVYVYVYVYGLSRSGRSSPGRVVRPFLQSSSSPNRRSLLTTSARRSRTHSSPRRSKLPDRFLARPGAAGRCIHTIADCSAASLLSFASSSLALTCSIRATAEASSRNTTGLFVERTSYVQLCPGSALVLPVLAHSRDVVAVPGCPLVPVSLIQYLHAN